MIKGNRQEGFTLVCDNCGKEVKNFKEFYEVVNYKYEKGWVHRQYKYIKSVKQKNSDFCPDCKYNLNKNN